MSQRRSLVVQALMSPELAELYQLGVTEAGQKRTSARHCRPLVDFHNEQLFEGRDVDPTLRLAGSLRGCYTIGVYVGRVQRHPAG